MLTTYHQLLPSQVNVVDATCDRDVALLQAGNVRIAGVREHDLSASALHDHLQIAALLPQHDAVVLRRDLH